MNFSQAMGGGDHYSNAVHVAGGMRLNHHQRGCWSEPLVYDGEIIVSADYNMHELPPGRDGKPTPLFKAAAQ